MKLDLETRFRYNECSFSSNDHFKILEKCALNTNQEIRKWHQRWWVKDLASFTSYAMIDWLLSFCLFRELYVVIVSSPLLSKIKYKYGLSANDVFSINDVAWRSRYARRKIYGNPSKVVDQTRNTRKTSFWNEFVSSLEERTLLWTLRPS